MRRARNFTVLAALLLTTACSGGGALGTLSDILGTMGGVGGTGQQQQGQVQVEVQSVDVNQQRIYVRTQQGQSGSVLFDQQTQVIYQQQRHQVTNLEPGDIVNLTVQQVGQNELYASRIDVVQDVRTRSGR